MKNVLRLVLLLSFALNLSYAQQAKIKIEAVTPHKLNSLGLSATTNSVSTGLPVVPNETFVYFSPQNIGNTDAITNAAYEFVSKPTGSAASLTTFNTNWAYFKADVKGKFDVKLTITTAGGTDDTTISVYAADFVGVGGYQGVAGDFPKCATCHSAGFSAIFDKWKSSGHAKVFERELETSDHYGTSCIKCHTTGADHNAPANNGGFDDVASSLGWQFTVSTPTSFDSIVSNYPKLVNLATIGCESCHGAGSLHGMSPNKSNISISVESGACAQCHDEPWRHNKVAEFENSLHAEALYSSSFKRTVTSNNLSNCARCHDANGYIAFTKGELFDPSNLIEADHTPITCATCHDPHDLTLRVAPASSDTLANGYAYTIGGAGKTCMNCHKARTNGSDLPNVTSSHWGPHHSTQADVLLGENAADFGVPFQSGAHKFAVEDACVGCHMAVSPPNGDENRDKVGGHTFRLHNPDNGKDYTASCESCHGPKDSFADFQALADYDGDKTIEDIGSEIDGLLEILADSLPPRGPEISWEAIRDASDPNMKKAYHNYQLIAYDGSRGMHNTKFAVDVLTKSIIAIGGIVPVELISFNATVENGIVTLKWETATETNNRGFEIEKKNGTSWVKIGFVEGKGTSSNLNSYSFSFSFEGAAVYRLKQIDLDGTFTYSKAIEVGANMPIQYALLQNYPNPFNPSTTIKFALPFDSNVKVTIYSMTGEVVKVLLNSVETAGNHEIQFNTNELGTSVSSGIYFYTLEANAVSGAASFRQTRKMILMK